MQLLEEWSSRIQFHRRNRDTPPDPAPPPPPDLDTQEASDTPTPKPSPPVKGPTVLPFVSDEQFFELLKATKTQSAGGPTGWSFRLCKKMGVQTKKFLELLWSDYTSGTFSPEVRAIMRLSRGVPIDKKGDSSDIRPLAVGECFRRLLASAACKVIGVSEIEIAGGPHQFACGTPSGTDVAGLLPRLRLEAAKLLHHGLYAIMGIDCRSAFQYISRYLMLEKVKTYLPQAYGIALNLYDGDSLIFLHEDPSAPYSRLTSSQGVHQGCNFSTIFFCIAIRDSIQE